MSLFQLSGPPKITRLDGHEIALPYPEYENFLRATLEDEAIYRNMADSSKKRAGSDHRRRVFRFRLCGLSQSMADQVTLALEQGEFDFIPRTKLAGDPGDEQTFRVLVKNSPRLSETIWKQSQNSVDLDVELHATEAIIDGVIPPTGIGPPTKIYYINFSDEIRSATIDPVNDPWTPGTIFTVPSDDPFAIQKDELNGYIILSQRQSGVGYHVIRYDADGTNPLPIYTTAAAGNEAHIAANRVTQRLYILEDGATNSLSEYDYAGNFIQSFSVTNGTVFGFALSEDGAYLHYVIRDAGLSYDFYRLDISTGTETQLDDLNSVGGSPVRPSEIVIDAAAGYAFLADSDSARIVRIDSPAGGNIQELAVGNNEFGIGVNRSTQRLYSVVNPFPDPYKILECDYAGGNQRDVVFDTCESIDLGV